jgi:hypothetical protein
VDARRFVGTVIVAICLGAPIVEVFDWWDQTAQDGNDTEANVVVAALCVGLALSAVGRIAAKIQMLSMPCDERSVCSTDRGTRTRRVLIGPPIPTSSPPIALRI